MSLEAMIPSNVRTLQHWLNEGLISSEDAIKLQSSFDLGQSIAIMGQGFWGKSKLLTTLMLALPHRLTRIVKNKKLAKQFRKVAPYMNVLHSTRPHSKLDEELRFTFVSYDYQACTIWDKVSKPEEILSLVKHIDITGIPHMFVIPKGYKSVSEYLMVGVSPLFTSQDLALQQVNRLSILTLTKTKGANDKVLYKVSEG